MNSSNASITIQKCSNLLFKFSNFIFILCNDFCRSLCKDRALIPLVRRTCLTAEGGRYEELDVDHHLNTFPVNTVCIDSLPVSFPLQLRNPSYWATMRL